MDLPRNNQNNSFSDERLENLQKSTSSENISQIPKIDDFDLQSILANSSTSDLSNSITSSNSLNSFLNQINSINTPPSSNILQENNINNNKNLYSNLDFANLLSSSNPSMMIDPITSSSAIPSSSNPHPQSPSYEKLGISLQRQSSQASNLSISNLKSEFNSSPQTIHGKSPLNTPSLHSSSQFSLHSQSLTSIPGMKAPEHNLPPSNSKNNQFRSAYNLFAQNTHSPGNHVFNTKTAEALSIQQLSSQNLSNNMLAFSPNVNINNKFNIQSFLTQESASSQLSQSNPFISSLLQNPQHQQLRNNSSQSDHQPPQNIGIPKNQSGSASMSLNATQSNSGLRPANPSTASAPKLENPLKRDAQPHQQIANLMSKLTRSKQLQLSQFLSQLRNNQISTKTFIDLATSILGNDLTELLESLFTKSDKPKTAEKTSSYPQSAQSQGSEKLSSSSQVFSPLSNASLNPNNNKRPLNLTSQDHTLNTNISSTTDKRNINGQMNLDTLSAIDKQLGLSFNPNEVASGLNSKSLLDSLSSGSFSVDNFSKTNQDPINSSTILGVNNSTLHTNTNSASDSKPSSSTIDFLNSLGIPNTANNAPLSELLGLISSTPKSNAQDLYKPNTQNENTPKYKTLSRPNSSHNNPSSYLPSAKSMSQGEKTPIPNKPDGSASKQRLSNIDRLEAIVNGKQHSLESLTTLSNYLALHGQEIAETDIPSISHPGKDDLTTRLLRMQKIQSIITQKQLLLQQKPKQKSSIESLKSSQEIRNSPKMNEIVESILNDVKKDPNLKTKLNGIDLDKDIAPMLQKLSKYKLSKILKSGSDLSLVIHEYKRFLSKQQRLKSLEDKKLTDSPNLMSTAGSADATSNQIPPTPSNPSATYPSLSTKASKLSKKLGSKLSTPKSEFRSKSASFNSPNPDIISFKSPSLLMAQSERVVKRQKLNGGLTTEGSNLNTESEKTPNKSKSALAQQLSKNDQSISNLSKKQPASASLAKAQPSNSAGSTQQPSERGEGSRKIDDVMSLAGIDLKEERQNILSSNLISKYSVDSLATESQKVEEQTHDITTVKINGVNLIKDKSTNVKFLDEQAFDKIVSLIAIRNSIDVVDASVVMILSESIRIRLSRLLKAMIFAAYHRTRTQTFPPPPLNPQTNLPFYRIAPKFDTRKQLAALEKVDRNREKKYLEFVQPEDGSITTEGTESGNAKSVGYSSLDFFEPPDSKAAADASLTNSSKLESDNTALLNSDAKLQDNLNEASANASKNAQGVVKRKRGSNVNQSKNLQQSSSQLSTARSSATGLASLGSMTSARNMPDEVRNKITNLTALMSAGGVRKSWMISGSLNSSWQDTTQPTGFMSSNKSGKANKVKSKRKTMDSKESKDPTPNQQQNPEADREKGLTQTAKGTDSKSSLDLSKSNDLINKNQMLNSERDNNNAGSQLFNGNVAKKLKQSDGIGVNSFLNKPGSLGSANIKNKAGGSLIDGTVSSNFLKNHPVVVTLRDGMFVLEQERELSRRELGTNSDDSPLTDSSSLISGNISVGPETPKVLITTTKKATKAGITFALDLKSIIPESQFVKRGSKFSAQQIIEFCNNREYTDLVIVSEDHHEPTHLTIVHLPNGPSAKFRLTRVVKGKKIAGHGNPTVHKPEVILNNFSTRLGHTIGKMFAALFPQVPEFEGRQTVTFHNQRDFIFFRRHRYEFASGTRVNLQEIGPRFTLRLLWLQKGLFHPDSTDYEWLFRPEMETSRRRFFL
ncbi:hypothetical protein BB560_001274 [Smittium megazygosporum]|uniref:Transcription initiation factor TFIID subunit 4 n=1 Tax=Smittium megazygosporum TaxID=133381 RepID=A0A2T9ZI22_9FUNG|nr:hypothetical protein BB560_001274 [Smittium megazygosporum]